MAPKWEYMVIPVGYEYEEEEMRDLNTYGEEGWELVAVVSAYPSFVSFPHFIRHAIGYDQAARTRITAYLKRIVTS